MRPTHIGSVCSRSRHTPLRISPLRRSVRVWVYAAALAVLGGLCLGVDLRAQSPPAAAATASPHPAAAVIPLGHYVPRNNLLFYLEFDGLDAHAEAWQKTAAYKMLNNTPLGTMLEEVAASFLKDR